MKKLLILLLTIFSFSSFAQDVNWENYSEKDGVIINKGMIDCNGNELLTFEITNTNNQKVFAGILILIALYLLIAFISFFFDWKADDSIVSGGETTSFVDDFFAAENLQNGFYQVREN